MKTCGLCRTPKEPTAEFFHRDSTSSDGLHSNCKPCRLDVNRKRWDLIKRGQKLDTAESRSDQRERRDMAPSQALGAAAEVEGVVYCTKHGHKIPCKPCRPVRRLWCLT